MVTAHLLIPLIVGVGFGLDFAAAYSLKSRLQNAADAAVVGSISKNSPSVTAAIEMSGDGPVPEGKADAEALFSDNLRDRILASLRRWLRPLTNQD
ncbi:Tad domain-containing protein [Mesorhizobium sp. CA14]|uniref:Tad domain-containing protein n=1 Tax=Mesorhizobium sp. CA14 TaxID=2876642 RepID=UPI001CCDA973|nr:Tad domain-containing protein [Mesorhizobium sp. CA14]